jgi:serine/threonine protein phosphatase PrpC
MPLVVRVGQASLAGSTGENQDHAAAVTPVDRSRAFKGVALAVSDGVGKGRGGGELAERSVRSFLSGWYVSPETWSVRRCLEHLIQDLNVRAREKHPGAACTFTAAILVGRSLHIAHVGDTRAWLLRGGICRQLTTDHVWDNPDLRNVLHRALGLDDGIAAQLVSQELAEGDRILLTCDGVHASLGMDGCIDLLAGDPDEACMRLVESARAAGSRDDATALLCEVVELPSPREDLLPDEDIDLPAVTGLCEGLEFDNFRLVRKLGSGRQSQVWLADDRPAERAVVLKIPNAGFAADAEFRKEFLREEWIGRRVSHSALVPLLALEPGRRRHLYYAMPWLPGHSLRIEIERHGTLSPVSLVPAAIRLCQGLMALHSQGVLHRDIKPDNVLVTRSGDWLLADLGVAHVEALEESRGHVPGTPSYMAPELFDGAVATECCEVFALGVTLYECLTGKLPWGDVEPFSRPRFGPPVPLSRWNPDLPPWLESIVLKAIAPDSQERFQVLSEMSVALERKEQIRSRGGSGSNADKGFRTRLLKAWAVLASVIALLEGLALLSR